MSLTRGHVLNTDSGTCATEFLPIASTTEKGTVELAANGETAPEVVVQGNDSRLSNPRTPTSHASSHNDGGSDEISISDAQLGSGAASSTTFLRGDRTWQEVTGGSGAPTDASYITTAAESGLSNEKVLGADIILRGTVASRPAAGVAGRLYLVTDSGDERLTRDNGSSWDDLITDWDHVGGKPTTFTPASHTSSSHDSSVEATANKNAANGYAGLDASSKITASQITELLAATDLSDVAAKTGTGTTVVMQGSPSLTTPTIGDFTNANHAHTGAASGGTLNASAIVAGTVATARLGGGTASSSTFLRGDQTWATPAGGSGDSTVRLTADRTNNTTSFADCTGLEFAVAASTNYWFDFLIIFQSAATGTGINLSLNGPASPTAIVMQKVIPTSLVIGVVHTSRAYNVGTASAGVDAANQNCIARVSGILLNGSNLGTLIVRFASETTTQVTIKAGSMGRLLVI